MIAPDPESERLRRLVLGGVASGSLATLIESLRSAKSLLEPDFATSRDAGWYPWSGNAPSLAMSLSRVPLYLLYKIVLNAIGVTRECSPDPEDREFTEYVGRSLLPGTSETFYLSLRLRPDLFTDAASPLGAAVRAHLSAWSDPASADPDAARLAIRAAFEAESSAPSDTLGGWLEAHVLIAMGNARALSLFRPDGGATRTPRAVLDTAGPAALILAGVNECELACLWNERGAVLSASSRAPN